MSSAYVLSSFIGRHTSGILISCVTYLNISEGSMLLQINSHYDYTRFSKRRSATFGEVPALSNISRKFQIDMLFTCVSKFWLVPTSNKHFLSPIRVDTIIDGVRRSSICRRFWESGKRFVEINSTLPLTKWNQKAVMKELDGFSLFKFIFAGYLWLLYICSLSLVLPEIMLSCCYITSWA